MPWYPGAPGFFRASWAHWNNPNSTTEHKSRNDVFPDQLGAKMPVTYYSGGIILVWQKSKKLYFWIYIYFLAIFKILQKYWDSRVPHCSGFQVELDQFRIRRNSQNLSPNMPNMHVVESASGGPKMPGGKARTGVGTDLRRLEAAGAGIQLLRAAAASRWETSVREEPWAVLWPSVKWDKLVLFSWGPRGCLWGWGGDHGDGRGAAGLPRPSWSHTRPRHQMAVSNHYPSCQDHTKTSLRSCFLCLYLVYIKNQLNIVLSI